MPSGELDFRALAENLPILCWIANPDGFISWYNRGWYEYTGTTPAAMEGWGWQSVHDANELPRVLDAWRVSIATGQPFQMVFPLRGADGVFRPFLTRVVPSTSPSGAIEAWYGVNTDISVQAMIERELEDRRASEARLRSAKAAAEDARHQADLARGEAERASAAKGDFLASMSHEIRTPLNAIIGYTDLLLEEYPDVAGLSRRLQLIQESGAALLTVVNDILDFSKIEAGQVEIHPAPFSPQVLVDNVSSMLAGFAKSKGVVIARSIDAAVPAFLLGDDSRLRQIVLNLANNAIKFTGAGTVSIAIEVESLSTMDISLKFVVKDTGIGISDEQQKKLFHRFSQVDGSVTRRYGGTGLGLAICKQLVELMGGTIGVESRVGEGATFWFRVRLPIAEPAAAPAPSPAPQTRTAGVSILLVEDVEVNQDLAKAVLGRLGHEVDIVSDGAEAVAKVRECVYDLVLMDVQMPVMDGMTATRIIRGSDHASATVPIIAMTANVMPQQIAALLEAGMDDHVSKPFKLADLQAAIGRWAYRGGDAANGRAGPAQGR